MPEMILKETNLRNLYLIEQKTDVEIADLFGCAKSTVYKARKRFGIIGLKRWQRHICEPTQKQLQIIYGSLLGDASISNGKKGNYDCESIFEEKHCLQQKDYVFWKYKELSNLCSSEPKETNIDQWRIRTFHHPLFSKLRNIWYPEGIKIVPKNILNEIGVLGLAVWYMDDGSLSKESNFIKLHTCSFSEAEHDMLSLWLKDEFCIKSHMKTYSGYRNIVIDLDSRKDFVNLIKDQVIESMKYKVTFREYYTWAN